MSKWICEGCSKPSSLGEYDCGRGLKKDKYQLITLKCQNCTSIHKYWAKYSSKLPNNIEATLETYEKFIYGAMVNSIFLPENGKEKDPTTMIGIINQIYLLLGMDKEKLLNETLENIKKKNEKDGSLFSCSKKIIKIARAKVDHTKGVNTNLSIDEIFPMVIVAANILVLLANKYNTSIFDLKCTYIRKIKFEKEKKINNIVKG